MPFFFIFLNKKVQQGAFSARIGADYSVSVVFIQKVKDHLGLFRVAVDQGFIAPAGLPEKRPGDGVKQ